MRCHQAQGHTISVTAVAISSAMDTPPFLEMYFNINDISSPTRIIGILQDKVPARRFSVFVDTHVGQRLALLLLLVVHVVLPFMHLPPLQLQPPQKDTASGPSTVFLRLSGSTRLEPTFKRHPRN